MQSKTLSSLFHPRYWLTGLGLSCLYLITRLPYTLQLTIGQGIGQLAYYLFSKRRRIANINLQHCFRTLSEQDRRVLLKKHFKSLGMGLIEAGMAWWLPDDKLPPFRVQGLDHIRQENPQGLLILTAHFTSLELCMRLSQKLFPEMACVYQEQNNSVLDVLIKRYRKAHDIYPIHRFSIREMVNTLSKQTVMYAADQDYGSRYSVFAPFFSIPAATIVAPSRLAARAKAKCLYASYLRLPDQQGYELNLSALLGEDFPSQDPVADATRFNAWLEVAIHRAPEQYFWVHRRFKTRPQGSAALY